MYKHIGMLSLAVVMGAASLAPAVAQPFMYGGMGYYGRGPMAGYMMGYGRAAIIDANDDGVISADEAAASADSVFQLMDADDDGYLTKDEYMAVRLGPQYGYNPARQAAMQDAKAARFKTMDSDGDGKVSKDEFLGAAKAHFAAADQDKDGKVTPWEFRREIWD